jgi:hypothetical protein
MHVHSVGSVYITTTAMLPLSVVIHRCCVKNGITASVWAVVILTIVAHGKCVCVCVCVRFFFFFFLLLFLRRRLIIILLFLLLFLRRLILLLLLLLSLSLSLKSNLLPFFHQKHGW